jgi:hypothetical protein
MPQSFSMRLFDRWLAENRTRFRHPPTAIVRRGRERFASPASHRRSGGTFATGAASWPGSTIGEKTGI